MIIVDWNQCVIAALFGSKILSYNTQKDSTKKETIDEDLLRHIVFDMLRSYIVKFQKNNSAHTELVIACDGKNSWRKEVFPYYKANRTKSRQESPHDWSAIYGAINKIRDEIQEIGLYTVIHIDHTEADDIISVLSKMCYEKEEPVVIVSSDRDFLQLQTYFNVAQWSPTKGIWLKEKEPVNYLIEHIIRGDSGDGIPSIFADDDVFVNEEKRSPPVTKKRIDEWVDFVMQKKTEMDCDKKIVNPTTKARFERNKKIIDLTNDKLPTSIIDSVLSVYETESKNNADNYSTVKSRFLQFLIDNKMKEHIKVIEEFFFAQSILDF